MEYLAVDGAYAKERFVSGAVELKLHVISKLRCDANLQFFYTGAQKRRGRPRKYAGKVDLSDLSRFTFVERLQPDVELYTAVLWHVSLKRAIRVAYLGVVKKQLHTFQVEYHLTPRVELLNLCPNDQCTNANVQFANHQQSIRLKNFMLR